ncbi:unnamed protein product [Ilex paraguariensis]|uniref:Uncharacterized protein n=1 Tax=Ilex paraguariensis TaxID=185542 RepID=A0ABC8R1G7_9AQUA
MEIRDAKVWEIGEELPAIEVISIGTEIEMQFSKIGSIQWEDKNSTVSLEDQESDDQAGKRRQFELPFSLSPVVARTLLSRISRLLKYYGAEVHQLNKAHKKLREARNKLEICNAKV